MTQAVSNGDFDAYRAFQLKQEHLRNHQTRYQQDCYSRRDPEVPPENLHPIAPSPTR